MKRVEMKQKAKRGAPVAHPQSGSVTRKSSGHPPHAGPDPSP